MGFHIKLSASQMVFPSILSQWRGPLLTQLLNPKTGYYLRIFLSPKINTIKISKANITALELLSLTNSAHHLAEIATIPASDLLLLPQAWPLFIPPLPPTGVFLQPEYKSDISLPWLKLYSMMFYWYIEGIHNPASVSLFGWIIFYSPSLKFCDSDKLKNGTPHKFSCYQHILLDIHFFPPGAPFCFPSWIHLINSYPPDISFQLTYSRKISCSFPSLSHWLAVPHIGTIVFCYKFVVQ